MMKYIVEYADKSNLKHELNAILGRASHKFIKRQIII